MKEKKALKKMYSVTLGVALHVMGPFGIGLDYTVRG